MDILERIPIGSMVLLYMVTFTINVPPMLAYIPYMDPMGYERMSSVGMPQKIDPPTVALSWPRVPP